MIAPISAQTILDAGESVPMDQVILNYTDPSDPTKYIDTIILYRTPWDERYAQAHPSHIDMVLDTFVVVRLSPVNGVNWPLPVWFYGGRVVHFEAIIDGFGFPVLDGDGDPTYTITHAGRPGPDLGGALYPITNQFNLSVECALSSPWGNKAQSISMSANFANPLETPSRIWAGGVDFTSRAGVQWFGRVDANGNPLSVPYNAASLTRCARLRSNLGGTDSAGLPVNIKIVEGRWNRDSRTLTFTSATGTLLPGMYIGPRGGQHGYALAENQIAAVGGDGITLTVASVPTQMGHGLQHAFIGTILGAVEITGVIAFIASRIVNCASTTGIYANDNMRWGIYNEATATWSACLDVIGQIDEIVDATSFRLKAKPISFQGTYWAWDGDVTVGGSDESVDIAADGYAGTPDGFTAAVS